MIGLSTETLVAPSVGLVIDTVGAEIGAAALADNREIIDGEAASSEPVTLTSAQRLSKAAPLGIDGPGNRGARREPISARIAIDRPGGRGRVRR